MVSLKLFMMKIRLFPTFILYCFYDYLIHKHYNKNKLFNGWGIHLFTGKFGAGKTCMMIIKAYELCSKYPQLTVLTNINVTNFPKHTKIIKLRCIDDILQAPPDTLVLIDEIGTIFNSRDFMKGQKSVPKALFQHLAQCRHRRIMIYGTVQRFLLLDKQIRDISDTVIECRCSFRHPFSRLLSALVYNIDEYEAMIANSLYIPRAQDYFCYIQTEKYRHLYDTIEMVQGMLEMEYLSDEEILRNRGEVLPFSDGSREAQKAYKKAQRRKR